MGANRSLNGTTTTGATRRWNGESQLGAQSTAIGVTRRLNGITTTGATRRWNGELQLGAQSNSDGCNPSPEKTKLTTSPERAQ